MSDENNPDTAAMLLAMIVDMRALCVEAASAIDAVIALIDPKAFSTHEQQSTIAAARRTIVMLRKLGEP